MPSIIVYGIYYHDHLSTTRVYPAQLAVVCNSHNTRKFPYYYYAIGAPSLISVTTFWASEIQGGYLGQGRRFRHFKQVRILKGVIMDTEGVFLGDHRHKESLFGDHGHGWGSFGFTSHYPVVYGNNFCCYILIETNPNFYFCSLS